VNLVGKLNHFRDNAVQCYANITLADGSPILVSLARTGVLIKKTRFGLFGKVLLKANVEATAKIAQGLFDSFGDPDWLPAEMTNPVLRQFTGFVMTSEDVETIQRVLGGWNETAQTS